MTDASLRRRQSTAAGTDAAALLAATPVPAEVRPGARNAIRTCLGLTRDESFVLITDWDSDPIAAALHAEAVDVGAETRVFRLGPGHVRNERVVERVLAALETVDVSVLLCAGEGIPRELRARIVATSGKRRHGHMVGITRAMMEQSMRADPREVETIGARLASRLGEAKELSITSGAGSRLSVKLSPAHRWHHASGLLPGPGWTNLPGGEMFTAPGSVDGVLVPDGGVWLGEAGELASSAKLRLHLSGGEVTRVEGPSESASQLEAALDAAAGARRVGQIGLGTNIGVIAAIGALMQDLKLPGVHFSLGHSVPELTSARFDAEVEYPLLLRRASLSADGEPILASGRYVSAIRDLRRED